MSKKLKIVFMGTSDFAVPPLQALCEAAHEGVYEIISVYTRPPAHAGRGKTLQTTPIHKVAEAQGLTIHTPDSLKKAETLKDDLQQADIAIVVAYGHIIPADLLGLPHYGFWNIHASLLPRWRGAAPINRAIMAGDRQTGISIMQMDEGLDTGAVLASTAYPIKKDTIAGVLHNELADLGAGLLLKTLASIDDLTPQPQNDNDMTYAAKIDKQETRIDWGQEAQEIVRHIHGLAPRPAAWFLYGDMRIKALAAEVVAIQETDTQAGQILDKQLTIACGDKKAVRLLKVQRAGKSPMDVADFLRGISETEKCAIVY